MNLRVLKIPAIFTFTAILLQFNYIYQILAFSNVSAFAKVENLEVLLQLCFLASLYFVIKKYLNLRFNFRNIFYLSITFLCLIYVNSGSTSELKQLINIFSSSTLISLAFFCVYSFPVSSTDIKLLPIKRKIKLPFYVSVDLFYKYSLSLFLLLTIVFLCYNTYISYTQARFDSQTTIFYAKQLCGAFSESADSCVVNYQIFSQNANLSLFVLLTLLHVPLRNHLKLIALPFSVVSYLVQVLFCLLIGSKDILLFPLLFFACLFSLNMCKLFIELRLKYSNIILYTMIISIILVFIDYVVDNGSRLMIILNSDQNFIDSLFGSRIRLLKCTFEQSNLIDLIHGYWDSTPFCGNHGSYVHSYANIVFQLGLVIGLPLLIYNLYLAVVAFKKVLSLNFSLPAASQSQLIHFSGIVAYVFWILIMMFAIKNWTSYVLFTTLFLDMVKLKSEIKFTN